MLIVLSVFVGDLADAANPRHCSFLPYGAGIRLKNWDLYQLLHKPDRIRSDHTIYR